jgi:hypothetical protein
MQRFAWYVPREPGPFNECDSQPMKGRADGRRATGRTSPNDQNINARHPANPFSDSRQGCDQCAI